MPVRERECGELPSPNLSLFDRKVGQGHFVFTRGTSNTQQPMPERGGGRSPSMAWQLDVHQPNDRPKQHDDDQQDDDLRQNHVVLMPGRLHSILFACENPVPGQQGDDEDDGRPQKYCMLNRQCVDVVRIIQLSGR